MCGDICRVKRSHSFVDRQGQEPDRRDNGRVLSFASNRHSPYYCFAEVVRVEVAFPLFWALRSVDRQGGRGGEIGVWTETCQTSTV